MILMHDKARSAWLYVQDEQWVILQETAVLWWQKGRQGLTAPLEAAPRAVLPHFSWPCRLVVREPVSKRY